MARKGKFLFGALIGAIFGLTFAPKKGKELRKDFKEEIKKGGYGEKVLKETVGKIGQDIVETSKEVYNDPNVQKHIKKGKKEMSKFAEQAGKHLKKSGQNFVKATREQIVKGKKIVERKTAKAVDTLKGKTVKSQSEIKRNSNK